MSDEAIVWRKLLYTKNTLLLMSVWGVVSMKANLVKAKKVKRRG